MCIETIPTKTKRTKKGAATAVAVPEPRLEPVPLRYLTNADIMGLLRQFKEATLPREQWTHAAHLIVALCYARLYTSAEAIKRLRAAIKHYNVASAKTPAQKTGYHETITLGWFHLVRHFLDVFDDGRSLPALADALVELYGSKDELFKHWSRGRLLGAEARAGWVEPDLAPLPELQALTRQDRNWLKVMTLQANRRLAAASTPRVEAEPVVVPTEVAATVATSMLQTA